MEAWGHRLWTIPPNSQGYLTLAGAWMAAGLPLPDDPSDPLWAHLTIEAARQAGFDRLEVLHEHADGAALLAESRLAPRRDAVGAPRATDLGANVDAGGTIYLCAVDADRMGVSLIQSNAAGWGSMLIVPGVRIFLQNRGLGFSLEPGHPAEYGPGRRPPHTLAPALVTTLQDELTMTIGTMGGDSQPQVLLQLLARLLHNGQVSRRCHRRRPVGDERRRGRHRVRHLGRAWAGARRRRGSRAVNMGRRPAVPRSRRRAAPNPSATASATPT